MKVTCFFLLLCFFVGSIFSRYLPLGPKRQGLVFVHPFFIPATPAHAFLSTLLPRDGRPRVMVLLLEAPLGAEDTNAPDDDKDQPLQEFQRCLQAMANGTTVREVRTWRTAYYAPKASRKVGNKKGITRTLPGKQEQGIPQIVSGCPMPTAIRNDAEVPLCCFTALLTRNSMLVLWYLVDVVGTHRGDRREIGVRKTIFFIT